MKDTRTSQLLHSTTFSKICLSSCISNIDTTQFGSVLGTRQSLFSVLDSIKFQLSLRSSFLVLESFVKNNFEVLFVVNIKNPVLLHKFEQVCRIKKYHLLSDFEIFTGFLTNKRPPRILVVSLFLDRDRLELIQKEVSLISAPLISFNDISSNKRSSLIDVCGNYNFFLGQNLILSLLSISLTQNYDKS